MTLDDAQLLVACRAQLDGFPHELCYREHTVSIVAADRRTQPSLAVSVSLRNRVVRDVYAAG